MQTWWYKGSFAWDVVVLFLSGAYLVIQRFLCLGSDDSVGGLQVVAQLAAALRKPACEYGAELPAANTQLPMHSENHFAQQSLHAQLVKLPMHLVGSRARAP